MTQNKLEFSIKVSFDISSTLIKAMMNDDKLRNVEHKTGKKF